MQPSFQILMGVTGLKGVIAFALASRALHEFPQGDVILTLSVMYSIAGVIFIIDFDCWSSD